MKLSVNEARLTNLWARNCGTIQKVFILSFRAFRKRVTDLTSVDRKIQNGNHRKQILSIVKQLIFI